MDANKEKLHYQKTADRPWIAQTSRKNQFIRPWKRQTAWL